MIRKGNRRNSMVVIGAVFMAAILMTAAIMPAMAYDTTDTCGCRDGCGNEKQNTEITEIIGIEKYSVVAQALNLDEVKALTEIPQSKDLQPLIDNARTLSLTRTKEDGSIEKATAVVLPVEAVAIDKDTVKTSNIVVVWDDGMAKAMKYTFIYSQGKTKELTFTMTGENNELINARIISDGLVVEELPAGLRGGYWNCVKDCVIGDCLCTILNLPCPPDTPAICWVCVAACTTCYYVPNVYSCGGCAVCLGVDLAICMWVCS